MVLGEVLLPRDSGWCGWTTVLFPGGQDVDPPVTPHPGNVATLPGCREGREQAALVPAP